MTTLKEDLALLDSDGATDRADLVASTTQPSEAYAEIVGLAHEAGLGFVHALALLLKCESERQQQDGSAEMFNGRALLGKWPVRSLHDALRQCFDDATLGTIDQLNVLVTEMRLLGLDQVATNSDALTFFARQQKLTREQASAVDEVTRRCFDVRKQAWLRLNEELGELCLLREDHALRMEASRQEFMQLFATEFLAERSELARLELARLALELLEKEPQLTAAQVTERLQEEIARRRETLAGYQRSAAYGLLSATGVNLQDGSEDQAQTKHLLRKLAMLIHPDRLNGLPLTDEQRQALMRIWHDTNRLRAQYDGEGRLSRSNELLRHSLRKAQQILEMAGIEDLDPTSTIRGGTLQERIDWLGEACDALEHRVASVQAELFVHSGDQELNYMRALLAAPETAQEEERLKMKTNAERYRTAAEKLERDLDGLLQSAATVH